MSSTTMKTAVQQCDMLGTQI